MLSENNQIVYADCSIYHTEYTVLLDKHAKEIVSVPTEKYLSMVHNIQTITLKPKPSALRHQHPV